MSSLRDAIRDVLADAAPTGLQLCATVNGRVVIDHDSLAGGDGRLVALHCASKPILALVATLAHVRGSLDLDEPLSARHHEFDVADKCALTLRHLFQHRAGLAEFSAPIEAWPNGEAVLAEVARRPSPHGLGPGRRTHYSVLSNWVVAGEILRRTLGKPVPLLARAALDELGVRDLHLTMDSDTFDREGARLAVTTHARRGEITRRQPDRRACALPIYGSAGFGTARSLVGFYAALAGSTVPEIAEARSIMTSNPVRDRDNYSGLVTSYGVGVAVDVKRVWFGDYFSPSSYGASGAYAGITGATDPAKGLSVALLFADYSPALTSYARRRRILEALFKEVEEMH